MRWKLCYVQLINSKQIVPNASIHVNGMNSNSYHFQMRPLKYFTYLLNLGWHQLLKMCWGSIIHGTGFRPQASLSKNPIVKHTVGEVCIHKPFLAGQCFSFSLKVQVMLLMNLICFCVYHTLPYNVTIIMLFVPKKLCKEFAMYTLRNVSHFEPNCMYTPVYGCLSKTQYFDVV